MGEIIDWIGMAQDRDRWKAPVSVVMILRVSHNRQPFEQCSSP
jgi:hypothetical protein